MLSIAQVTSRLQHSSGFAVCQQNNYGIRRFSGYMMSLDMNGKTVFCYIHGSWGFCPLIQDLGSL